METEFLHHALISYENDVSKNSFSCIYEFIENNVEQKSLKENTEDGSVRMHV